jgi:hypothetical protein
MSGGRNSSSRMCGSSFSSDFLEFGVERSDVLFLVVEEMS